MNKYFINHKEGTKKKSTSSLETKKEWNWNSGDEILLPLFFYIKQAPLIIMGHKIKDCQFTYMRYETRRL